jgi:hypothetical protein
MHRVALSELAIGVVSPALAASVREERAGKPGAYRHLDDRPQATPGTGVAVEYIPIVAALARIQNAVAALATGVPVAVLIIHRPITDLRRR